MLSDVLVAFDHLKHTVTILANVYADDERGLEASYDDAVDDDRQGAAAARRPAAAAAADARPPAAGVPLEPPPEQFEGMVARIVDYIRAGDAYQVVPSQRWSAELDLDPSRSTAACASSTRPVHVLPGLPGLPGRGRVAEPLLTVTGRHVSTRPIAGTRRAAPTRPRTPASPRACSPTRRSAPST